MNEILKRITETLMVVLGNCLYAFGVAMFIVPGGLITGGSTGIGLFVADVTGISVTAFVFVFNLVMFLIGFFVFGKKFAANTIVSTFSYPIALELITRLLGGYRLTDDMLLCMVFGGYLDRCRNRNRDTDGSVHRRYGYSAACAKPLFSRYRFPAQFMCLI